MTMQMFQRKCLACERMYPAEVLVCEDDGTQLAAILTQSLVGDTLGGGKYELIEELGRGGMGVVFRARHKLMDRIVAIKMLIDDLGRDETALARFHVEAKAAAALSHANIIRIYDFDVSQHGFPFIVMDYLQGQPLDGVLQKEKCMQWQRALPIFLKVCDALGHAHRRQVVHRDIKPSNIMLVTDDDDQEVPMVLDFGIAKLFTQAGKNASRLTRTGEIFGSPLYMSPEQCLGQPVDPRSDIYSLGCLMLETLTGQAPFEREGFLQVILAHINSPVPSLEQLAPDMVFPAKLSEVLAKAMSKDCTERYDTMQAFKKALSDVLGTGQTQSHDLKGSTGDGALQPQPADPMSDAGMDYKISPPVPLPDAYLRHDSSPAAGGGKSVVNQHMDPEFKKMLAGAERGEVEVQYDLGWSYRKGESGAPKDLKMAFYWMLRAAQQGQTQAMNCVSDMYLEGEGVEQDYKEAFHWRQKSAEAGDALGQWNLGYMYQTGCGCDEDADLCAYWYRKAADQGHDGAQADIGWCYNVGFGVEANETEACDWYAKAAEQGNPLAQVKLARALRWGWGVPADIPTALEWYERAADNGRLDAQHELALLLLKGHVCKQDTMEGARRLRLAAQKNYPEAQNYLGLCLEFGWNKFPVNEAEAFSWYRKAAEQGLAEAAYNLGSMYEDGKSVTADDSQALRWFRRGAEDGAPPAMSAYSRFLYAGRGCDKNPVEGLKWLKKAAEQENPSAMYRLALKIDAGEVDDPENFTAMDLFRKAADEEHDDAQFHLGKRLVEAGELQEGLEYLRKSAEQGNESAIEELKNMQAREDGNA